MTVLRFLIIGLALCFANSATMAQDAPSTGPPDAAGFAAARDLMEVMGVNRQMDAMMESVKQGFLQGATDLPADKKTKFEKDYDAVIKKFADYREEMLADFAALYAQNFSAEDMRTVADFYRSGPGAKFIALMPKLMLEGQVIGLKYSKRLADDMKPADDARPQ